MRWQDLEAKQFGRLEPHVLPSDPRRPWPVSVFAPPSQILEGLLTHCARAALGFAAPALDVGTELRAGYRQFVEGVHDHHRDDVSNGVFALLGAHQGDWDLVGDCTGGPLGNRVVIKKVFGEDLAGLARHLATVARGKLPAGHALAAMEEVRARFTARRCDPRIGAVATALFVRDIVRADDPVAAARAWLDGERLELDDVRPIEAPADGEDPRVKIFERFAPELSDEAAIAAGFVQYVYSEPWGRHVERDRAALDDLVIRAFIGRLPLPPRWEVLVDPVVAALLGASPPGVETRLRDLTLLRARAIRGDWDDAAFALVVGTGEQLAAGKLPKWKPGKFYKDDARKLLGYIAAAIVAGAGPDAVLPAWLDFLSRRSPATTPLVAKEKAPLRWKHLLLIQCAITHRLGGRERGDVGRALQEIATGA